MLNMRNATGKSILLRLSIHCAISCGVIVVKLLSRANVGLLVTGFGGGEVVALLIVTTLPAEPSGIFSSSIFTEGTFIVLGKL